MKRKIFLPLQQVNKLPQLLTLLILLGSCRTVSQVEESCLF